MLKPRLSREASMALLPRLLARRAAPLRVALAARLALPAQRVLSTSAPSVCCAPTYFGARPALRADV